MRLMRTLTVLSFGLALALLAGNGRVGATVILTCDGKIPTIVGSGEITGTSGPDVIIGSAGPDVIDGGSGDDTICGEGGDDVVNGGSGSDRMWGEVRGGTDPLDGVAGDDVMNGGSGNDLVVDTTGFDQTLDGGSGKDTIIGEGEIVGGSGADSIRVLLREFGDDTTFVSAGSGKDTCDISADTVPTVLDSCEIVVD